MSSLFRIEHIFQKNGSRLHGLRYIWLRSERTIDKHVDIMCKRTPTLTVPSGPVQSWQVFASAPDEMLHSNYHLEQDEISASL